MSAQLRGRWRWSLVLALGLLMATTIRLTLPGTAAPSPSGAPVVRTMNGVPIDPEIAAIWQRVDAPVVYKAAIAAGPHVQARDAAL